MIEIFLKTSAPVQITVLILISFSIISWSVILNRVFILKKAQYHLKLFENKFWTGIELPKLYQDMSNKRNRLNITEHIFYIGFKEFSRLYQIQYCIPETIIKRIGRSMYNTMNAELVELERYIPIIGTVGSISPYVGLFGTVLGIMHVFLELEKINNNYQIGSTQIIAPGIAEALISTSIGLFVSIPAIVAFNYLIIKIDSLNKNYNNFIEEFITILHIQLFSNLDSEKIKKGEKE